MVKWCFAQNHYDFIFVNCRFRLDLNVVYILGTIDI